VKTTRFGDLRLSIMMLGTVQLGMGYGVANKSGQPPYETARDMLACAHDGGVNCLDTAAAYGTSEQVIGSALADLGIADEFTIVTKVPAIREKFPPGPDADRFVEESVVRSLKALRLEVLSVCLFHWESDFLPHAESLLKLKERGLVRHVGLSAHTPAGVSAAISSGLAEAVQIPSSIFDHRFLRQGIFDQAAKSGVAVFVRSIYLQGLVLMPEHDIPPHLAQVVPIRRKLEALAKDAGMTIAELAVRHVLGLTGLTCAVVGAESEEQVRNNAALFSEGPLDETLTMAIAESVPDLPDEVIFPGRWAESAAAQGAR